MFQSEFMKYFYLFLFIVYLPLFVMYFYQRGNDNYKNFKWGVKNRIGVWLAILLALLILSAKLLFPFFVYSINIGWEDFEGDNGGEILYCIYWLISLTLLIFPHLIKKSKWSSNPSSAQYYDRFSADGYWYIGLVFSVIPILITLSILN